MKLKDVRAMDVHTIELGGQERVVQYDMNAFAYLENKYGSISEAMQLVDRGKVSELRYIMWAGLIHAEVKEFGPDGEPTAYNITPYQVGSWMSKPAMIQMVTEVIGRAMAEGMPEQEQALQQAIDEATADPKMATIVLTPEEQKAQVAEEAKNG